MKPVRDTQLLLGLSFPESDVIAFRIGTLWVLDGEPPGLGGNEIFAVAGGFRAAQRHGCIE